MVETSSMFWSVPLLIVSLLVTVTSLRTSCSDEFVLVINAGSSGSRLHIYRQVNGEVEEITPADKENAKKFAVNPGISSFIANPAEAAVSVQPMLQAALEYVPEDYRSATKVHLLATAGMRLLPFDGIRAVLQSLDAFFENPANCQFAWRPSKVLSGEEEATFEFITANYVAGTLGQQDSAQTIGIMEMGGASMQLAFQPKEGIILQDKLDFYDLSGKLMSIYGHSWMRYGADQAFERANEVITKMSMARGSGNTCENPCLLDGDTFNTTVNGVQVSFIGTGDYVACLQVTQGLMHLDYECPLPPCTVAAAYEPHFRPDAKFYGLAAFYNTAQNLGLMDTEEEKALTPSAFVEKSWGLCGRHFDQATSQNPMIPEKFLRTLCFRGAYVVAVLEAFGFPKDYKNLYIAKSFNGTSTDWSLGAALFMTKLMPTSKAAKAHTLTD